MWIERGLATDSSQVGIDGDAVSRLEDTSRVVKHWGASMFKWLWRQGALRYTIEMADRTRELALVRTSFKRMCLFLDGSPLDAALPVFFLSARTVALPDGSNLTISPGQALRRDGIKLKPVTWKPLAILVLIWLFVIAAGTAFGGFIGAWFDRPDWQKSNPPLWVFVGSGTTDNHTTRWFINSRVLRVDGNGRVKALIRAQTAAAGEPERADVPKDDEYTTVQNFTCRPSQQGYDLSAQLAGYSGKQVPAAIPPD